MCRRCGGGPGALPGYLDISSSIARRSDGRQRPGSPLAPGSRRPQSGRSDASRPSEVTSCPFKGRAVRPSPRPTIVAARRPAGDESPEAGRSPGPSGTGSRRDPRTLPCRVLLRRPGLAPLRADLRSARVLPDPDRGRHPPRTRRRDGRRLGVRPGDLVELGSGSSSKTRRLIAAGLRAYGSAPLRPDRRLGRDPRRVGPRNWPRNFPRPPRDRLRGELSRDALPADRLAASTGPSCSSSSAPAWGITSPTTPSSCSACCPGTWTRPIGSCSGPTSTRTRASSKPPTTTPGG